MDVPFALVMILVGACAGILLASALVPKTRNLAVGAGIVVVISGALLILLTDAANLLAALGYSLTTVLASVLYSAYWWRRELSTLPQSYFWFVTASALHPNYLRHIFLTQQDDHEDLASANR